MNNVNKRKALGIDIGGTGIKGAIVDTVTGEFISERIKLDTPSGGEPKEIIKTVSEIINLLPTNGENLPMGVCFPAIVKDGVTKSAANVSKKWVGLNAAELFEKDLKKKIYFLNDADAAGFAEVKYGAAKNKMGKVLVTTLGTGIGSAFIVDGKLIPNFELGHLLYQNDSFEKFASNAARVRDNLNFEDYASRLTIFFKHLELLFSPDLFVVGGGVSKSSDKFIPLINIDTPIVPADHRNKAGIMGAAYLASAN